MAQNNAINAPLPLSATQGGLGLASPTAHGVLVGEGSSPVTSKVLTNGQLLIGSTGSDPVAATLTAGTNVTLSSGPGSITINSSTGLSTPIAVAEGGTGASFLGTHGILVGEGTSPITSKILTDGQLLIGSTGADPVPATLTAGTDITINNTAGGITINAAGVGTLPWTTEGDMLYYTAGAGARLPIGPNLSILHSNGTDPEWYSQAYDDGIGSVAFGTGSLSTTPAGASANTAFGYTALSGVTTGAQNNTAFGYSALGSGVITGSNNTCVGIQALAILTTANGCTTAGYFAGDSLTTSSFLASYGYEALSGGSTGVDGSSAFGPQALRTITSGTNNNSFGFSSMFSANNTSNNCAFGTSSLLNTTALAPSNAFGNNTLNALTSGTNNSIFGYNGAVVATTASNCSGFGDQVLAALTTGNTNSVLGASAADGITTSSNVTAIGYSALGSMTAGSNTVALGASAGSARASYTNCTFLGSSADASASGLTNACAIGSSASVGVSNAMVLGNGCFVGIGKNSPAYALHMGTDNSSVPNIYMASTAVPSAPATANDGIFSVDTGKPTFTSGTAIYQGRIPTFKPNVTCGLTVLNGTSGIVINTTAITAPASLVFVTPTFGVAPPNFAIAGSIFIADVNPGVSFTIYSTNASDVRSCCWQIINQ